MCLLRKDTTILLPLKLHTFAVFLHIMTWSTHIKATILLALPVCFSNMGHIVVDLTDNFFIGQLPEKTAGQAAVSLAGAIYTTILVLAIGISYGITPIVAELSAKNAPEKIVGHLRQAIMTNFLVSVVLLGVLFLITPLLHQTDQPKEVTDLAIRFLGVIMLSMVPLSLFFTFKQFLEGLSDTKAAMFITLSGNALNIALNYAMVFGNWGFPQLGVMGSCWATFIARMYMGLALPVYVYFHPIYKKYRSGFIPGKWDKSIIREQLKIGVPSGLMFVMEVAAFGIPTLFIPGTEQLAAHRVALGLAALSYMISSGIGAAATIRVGHFVGLNDPENIRKSGYSAVLLSLVVMSIAALVFIIGNTTLPSYFNNDPGVLAYAGPLLLIGAAFQLFDGTQVVSQGALRGLKDTLVPGIIAFAAYWVVGLPISYVFCVPMQMGVNGVWYGFVVGLAVASIGFIIRFRRLALLR
jgi:MATE family multidrug resistance protein